jgi:hemerythrin-like domain-containing protein
MSAAVTSAARTAMHRTAAAGGSSVAAAPFEPKHASIALMMREHANVRGMCAVIRGACLRILQGEAVPVDDMRGMIRFVREYSDAHHHAKEERFLFPEMVARLGRPAENLVTHGMLVEHNEGRAHVLNWENALGAYESAAPGDARWEAKLDIVAEAMGYAKLLVAHTQKEDAAVYPFAERSLESAVLDEVDARCTEYEATADAGAHLRFLSEMQRRYL